MNPAKSQKVKESNRRKTLRLFELIDGSNRSSITDEDNPILGELILGKCLDGEVFFGEDGSIIGVWFRGFTIDGRRYWDQLRKDEWNESWRGWAVKGLTFFVGWVFGVLTTPASDLVKHWLGLK
jgi:hypothetical protein